MLVQEYLDQINRNLSYLVAFARQVNELDLAGSLFQEMRGMQDAGWSTTITAYEVFDEIMAYSELDHEIGKSEFRTLLSLYAQLSEAGGVYEGLRNLIGVVQQTPFSGWPFRHLVRVRAEPKRIIGPNANATFRDLAQAARDIGMLRFSELLEVTFMDDIRNGISHADYIIWNDELRLRKRNGGQVYSLRIPEVIDAVNTGVGFFSLLKEHNNQIALSFNPARDVFGKFSENTPMMHTVEYNIGRRSFSISTSSPGGGKSPVYERQCYINDKLGGKVFSLYVREWNNKVEEVSTYIEMQGFEPQIVVLPDARFSALLNEVDENDSWDQRFNKRDQAPVLLVSPWGFIWLESSNEFDGLLPPVLKID